ncbi:MAG TPA: hypothetical protein P5531_04005 [Bacteroidales bacterium]|nr:hypothetical protein [Bacteroidales bacterium]
MLADMPRYDYGRKEKEKDTFTTEEEFATYMKGLAPKYKRKSK